MDWEKLVKRYVWDDDRTPYFVVVKNLTRRQADYEIFAYTVFVGVLFFIVAVILASQNGPYGASYGAAIYALSVVGAIIAFQITKHAHAAIYCAGAPIAALLYLWLYGFHPNLDSIDHLAIIVFMLAWLRYAWRVIAIGRAYDDMPDARAK